MHIRLERALLENHEACEDGLAYFDSLANGATFIEAEWTAEKEIEIQQVNPRFVGWMRAQGLIPMLNAGGMDLGGLDLTGADLRGADLSGADLTDTVLTDAQVENANLNTPSLGDAVLTNVDLTGALSDVPPSDEYASEEGVLYKKDE